MFNQSKIIADINELVNLYQIRLYRFAFIHNGVVYLIVTQFIFSYLFYFNIIVYFI